MIVINDRPCDGIDMSHWNTEPRDLVDYNWIKFFGHKATHFGGRGMVDGVDPRFATRRQRAAHLNIRWRAFYSFLVSPVLARPVKQVELLLRTVGDLDEGESVYLDWEDTAVTLSAIEDFIVYMNLEFPGRWFMYVNDVTPDMKTWMQSNLDMGGYGTPIMHPNYSLDKGLSEALRWKAMIWQTGTGTFPGTTAEVPLDYVLKAYQLDEVCGL